MFGVASTFVTTGSLESAKRTRESSRASFSAAGAINAQWKGAETGSGIVRLAPSWRAFEHATSTAAARAFGLYPERGVVREGAIADVVIFDPELERIADADDDPSNSDYTPFQGWAIKGWPVVTIRRGEVVYENGQVIGQPGSGRPADRLPWSTP